MFRQEVNAYSRNTDSVPLLFPYILLFSLFLLKPRAQGGVSLVKASIECFMLGI